MQIKKSYVRLHFVGVVALLLLLSFFSLLMGSIDVELTDVYNAVFDYSASSEQLTVRVFRFPRVIAALFGGAALAVSGLLMQTLFKNALAGPYVLGINSGASLFVAIVTMTGVKLLTSDISLAFAAMLGAFATGVFILFAALYVRSQVSLLLVGIMFGAFAGAFVNVIQSYSSPDDLKSFMMWSFGSLQNLQLAHVPFYAGTIVLGLLLTGLLIKPLNILVIGEDQARVMGVRIRQTRFLIIFVTAILTGVVTAFCGPIAFVGLIVPNIVKLVYKTAHHGRLLLASFLWGGITLLCCDILMQWMNNWVHLPLNALTAMIGAPIVVWIIMKRF
jgi:iron complex transport system permease protein